MLESSTVKMVDSVIYSFHMPLFFFLSGLLFIASLTRRGSVGLMYSKVETIAYPYLIWSLIQGFCEVSLSKYTNGNVTSSEVLALAWIPRAQFWFLYALFIIFAGCSLLYVRLEKRWYVGLLIVFALFYVFKVDLSLNFVSNFFCSYAVFFALGICFNDVREFIDKRKGLALMVFGWLFVVGQYIFHVYYGLSYSHGGWPTLALAIVSVLFVVCVSMWLHQFTIGWLEIFGGASMSIYLMHVLPGSGIRVVLKNDFHIYDPSVHIVLGTAAGLTVPLIAQVLIKKYQWGFLLAYPRRFGMDGFRSK
jgi:fucose 4-O-acetylase-like acetyltransferase